MRDREHNIQVAAVNWFRHQYPECLIWATPNGGQRNAIVAAKLKAEGVMSGVPDLFIAVARGRYHGLFVEMKAGKNKPTQAQNDVMSALLLQGYKCEVCYSAEEFITIANDYLKP